MKKAIIIGCGIILLFVLVAGSYKPLIYSIFNEYEEVCIRYKMNVITKEELDWYYGQIINKTEYISTGECIEYGLRRKLCKNDDDECQFNRTFFNKIRQEVLKNETNKKINI